MPRWRNWLDSSDLKSDGESYEGSNPSRGTNNNNNMKKLYPTSCDGLPDSVLNKLTRYTLKETGRIREGWVEIYDTKYDQLSDEDKVIIKLRGIHVNRKFFWKDIPEELYSHNGFPRD